MYLKPSGSMDNKLGVDEALQELGLKRNEIKIIKSLVAARGRELSVHDISKLSDLPISRTYALLKNLSAIDLVDKRVSGGVLFSIKDPELKFHNFIMRKYGQIMKIEKRLYELLPQTSSAQAAFIEINNDDDFYRTACQIALRSKEIKAFARTPVLFVAEEQIKSFLRAELLKIYREKISSGAEFFYIINESHFKNLINKNTKNKIIKNINWCLSHKNFHLAASDSQYLKMMKGERDALLSLQYSKAGKIISALHIRSGEVIRIFDHTYNDVFENARQIKKVLELIST